MHWSKNKSTQDKEKQPKHLETQISCNTTFGTQTKFAMAAEKGGKLTENKYLQEKLAE